MSVKRFQRDLASAEANTLQEQMNRKSMRPLKWAIRKVHTYRQFVHVIEEARDTRSVITIFAAAR